MRLQHFFTPEKSTVLSLACGPQSLYAGLVNGTVAIYAKAEGNCVPLAVHTSGCIAGSRGLDSGLSRPLSVSRPR